MKVIAKIVSPYKEKFGIPRQSRLVNAKGKIVFEREFSKIEAFNGLKDFSHIWVLWEFSENSNKEWTPTVRPPRLGGNKRVGVFATRSPFRPNSIGLSCVRLLDIYIEDKRVVLSVEGIDMLDGTPVFDIKPYVPYTDSIDNAIGGFADSVKDYSLKVEFDDKIFFGVDEEIKGQIISILSGDPRPSYQDDPDRIYGLNYADYEIKFSVNNGILSIKSIK